MIITESRRISAFCIAIVFAFMSVASAQSDKPAQAKKPSSKIKTTVVRRSHRRTHRHTAKKQSTGSQDTAQHTQLERHYPAPGSSGEQPNGDWYRNRAFPNEYIDPAAYPAALEQAHRIPSYRPAGRYTTQSAMTWQPIGPFKIGGRVTAIATHPTDPNTFYVGGAAGGLWKTTDHGDSWRSLTDTFSAISVGCITIDPADANTIYLGMGECNSSADSYPGNGLWRSQDGGTTWSYLGFPLSQYISKVIVNPRDRNTIWVCIPGPNNPADTNRGIWKSTDFGTTWTRTLLVRVGKAKNANAVATIDLVMNPLDTNDLVAASWQQVTSIVATANVPFSGLWRTRDGGANWNRIDTITGSGYVNGSTYKRLARTSLLWTTDYQDSTSVILYALTSKVDKDPITGYALAENFYKLFKTTDPESGWKSVLDSSYRIPFLGNNIDSVDIFNRQGGYDNLLAVNPRRLSEIYIGGIDVLRSTDWGTTWTDISNAYPHYFTNDRSQHSDMHAIAFTAAADGNDLLNGQDGGVFNTHDAGATWTQLKGLPITMFYHLEPWVAGMAGIADPLPADSIKVFGGTQDNGTVSHGFSSNSDWDWINRGDGGMAQSDPNDPSHIVTSLELGRVFFRTTLDSLRPNLFSDNGNRDPNAKKWFEMLTIMRRRGITDSSEACAFVPPVVLDKRNGVDLYTGRTAVYRIKMNFNDPDSLTQIWKWSPQLTGYSGNPKAWYYGDINTLALGVRDANGRPMLWAGGELGGGRAVWRTTVNSTLPADSMPKWIRADRAGLPGLAPVWIEADRSDSLTAFLGFSGYGAGHLYRTSDGGSTWKNISGNLPNAPMNAFVIDSLAEHGDPAKKNQCIIAATDVGVFVTTDGGTTWSNIGSGMPNLVVGSLTMYRNWVIAGTHGRSAWAIDVSSINAEQRGVTTEPLAGSRIEIRSVYPNPARDVIRFSIDDPNATGSFRLELFDLKGVSVLRNVTDQTISELRIPSGLNAGIYILRATNERGESAESKIEVAR